MEISALAALRYELRSIHPGHSSPLKWSNKRARFRHTGQGHPGARARPAPARYPGPGGAGNIGWTAPVRYRPKSGRVRGARPGCKTGRESLSQCFASCQWRAASAIISPSLSVIPRGQPVLAPPAVLWRPTWAPRRATPIHPTVQPSPSPAPAPPPNTITMGGVRTWVGVLKGGRGVVAPCERRRCHSCPTQRPHDGRGPLGGGCDPRPGGGNATKKL